jgi:hypothetical protein
MNEPKCTLCGEPMPSGEEMFKFHGYSGPCPAPPLPKTHPDWIVAAAKECAASVLVGEGERAFTEIIAKHAAFFK